MIKPEYQQILDELYEITEGNIIIGGSTSLFLQGIINRKIDDVDFNLLKDDWLKYEGKIQRRYRVYKGLHITNKDGSLNIDIATCLTKINNVEFHLFINHIFYPYNVVKLGDKEFRILSPEIILKDKEWIVEEEPHLTKHLDDIEKIKLFLK